MATTYGNPVSNVVRDSLPIGWEMPDSLELKDWDNEYRLELFDDDVADADDRMEVIRFSVGNFAISGYQGSYTVNKGDFRVRFLIRWE